MKVSCTTPRSMLLSLYILLLPIWILAEAYRIAYEIAPPHWLSLPRHTWAIWYLLLAPAIVALRLSVSGCSLRMALALPEKPSYLPCRKDLLYLAVSLCYLLFCVWLMRWSVQRVLDGADVNILNCYPFYFICMIPAIFWMISRPKQLLHPVQMLYAGMLLSGYCVHRGLFRYADPEDFYYGLALDARRSLLLVVLLYLGWCLVTWVLCRIRRKTHALAPQ